jgi:hypothetical protein
VFDTVQSPNVAQKRGQEAGIGPKDMQALEKRIDAWLRTGRIAEGTLPNAICTYMRD